ncbi:hypothetical protein Pmani_003891 [Petrolisthes manimaculis]|uniref:Uncharacterized protein n=1 Tax=Petrolisthes manimaculis TaxID=1843537 RepID=A0AAE1QFD9_9EUCA|nr:hypothetical protein Pmani_003891 [Petrolisthes manimaculis]
MPSLSSRTSNETYSEQSASPCLAHKIIGQCRASSPHSVLRKSTPISVSPTFSGLQWQRFMLFCTVFCLQAMLRVHQLSRMLLIVYLQTFLQTLFTFHSQETTFLLQVQMKRAGHRTRVSSHWIVTRDEVILRALQRFQVQHSMWTLVENIVLREIMGEVEVSYVFKWKSLTQLPQSIFPQGTTEEVSKAAAELALLSQLPTPNELQPQDLTICCHFLQYKTGEQKSWLSHYLLGGTTKTSSALGTTSAAFDSAAAFRHKSTLATAAIQALLLSLLSVTLETLSTSLHCRDPMLGGIDMAMPCREVVEWFLCHLFHVKNRTLATIRTHEEALKAPMFYGCNLTIDTQWLDWLHRSFFLQRPPCHQPRQFWSLGKSTGFLGTYAVLNIAPSKDQLFRKALFLTALTLDMRASQLHALSRHAAWTVFATNDAPVPLFMTENGRERHSLLHFTIPVWFEEGIHRLLCPFVVLRSYLLSTEAAPWENIFVWPHSLKKCSRLHIAQELCMVIESVDLEKCPKSQDVRKMAASFLFLCFYSLDTTRQGGQWSSLPVLSSGAT